MNSLKRHPALQPLSRDHVIGLHQAQILKKARVCSVQDQDRAIAGFAEAWEDDLIPHFADEERILPGYIPNESSRLKLINDHLTITALAEKVIHGDVVSCSQLLELGETLEAHIRWEEHSLFPEIEDALNAELSVRLTEQTDAVEASRHRESGKFAKGR